ncbi:MAG TPA: hypothetical protein VN958_22050 [Chitinophagaceae bacterium]|nr:hypothetical protein [Chitinophagaceae bacterium]
MQVPHMCAAYLWFAQQISNRTKVSDTTGDTTCTSTHPIKTNKHHRVGMLKTALGGGNAIKTNKYHRVVVLFCVNQTSNQILIGVSRRLECSHWQEYFLPYPD